MPERFRRDGRPTDFSEQVTVNSEQVSRGAGAANRKGTKMKLKIDITKSTQNEDASGGDNNAPTQVNPVTTTMTTGK